jgi:hypothetical protein
MIANAFFPTIKRLPVLWSRRKSLFLPPGDTILIPEDEQHSVDGSHGVPQDRASRFDLGRLEGLLVEENMAIISLPSVIYK